MCSGCACFVSRPARTPEGHDTVHATFVGTVAEGEVSLSIEHTAFGWTTAADYIAQWCSEDLEAAVPAYGGWIREVRANCQLVAEELSQV